MLEHLAEAHPEVIENYNLTQRVYLGEIDLDLVYDNSNRTIISTIHYQNTLQLLEI